MTGDGADARRGRGDAERPPPLPAEPEVDPADALEPVEARLRARQLAAAAVQRANLRRRRGGAGRGDA